ncbi:hypothetical protein UPYG_G00158460 [Umbra pygmaea]|uniref:Fibronectin type-III domain-containing protein n=1 Tax=Umbra pygmaea TaxID=75934 RepID=A0ABD0WZY8_UMBPY
MIILLFARVAFLAYSVFAVLPSPYNLKMDAVNTRYILRWAWNRSLTNYSISFTTKYVFSNEEQDLTCYKVKCIRITEMSCDFSDVLRYSSTYVLAVTAVGMGQRSNFSRLYFVPDVDAALGPPTHVKLEPGDDMVNVNFREPMTEENTSMSSVLHAKVYFRLQYWEKKHPGKKHEKDIDTTETTLSSLKPWTEYCLHVNAFSLVEEWNKTSPYTQPQCFRTRGKGHPPVWQVLLALLACVSVIVLTYMYYQKKVKFSEYTFPSRILPNTQGHTSLFLPWEESFAVTSVVAASVEQTSPHQQVQVKDRGVVEAEHDSGFSSGFTGQ